MNIQSPGALRRALARVQATRILYAGGMAPIRSLINSISQVLLPSSDDSKPTTTPVYFNNGDTIYAQDITTVAANLQQDTDILQLWADNTEKALQQSYLTRNARRQALERRIRQLSSKSSGLSNYSQQGSSLGAGSSSINIDFTDLSLIDFTNTTTDIIPAGGPDGAGEATLACDPLRSRVLNIKDFKLLAVNIPQQTQVLSDPSNILSPDSTEPYQVILPGTADGSVGIVIQLNSNKLPVPISGIELDGINQCNVDVSISTDNKNWTDVGSGSLAPLGRTVIRFNRQEAAYITITLSGPKTTTASTGETIGLRSLRVFNAYYVDSSVLVTPALLAAASPLQGVNVNVDADIPPNCSIDVQVSFTSPTGGFVDTQSISAQAGGMTYQVWNSNVTREQIPYTYAIDPGDGTRFWQLPPNSDTIVEWDSILYVGTDQWYVETIVTNNSQLDYPYKTPDMTDWSDIDSDQYDSGAIFPTIYPSISGDISAIDFTSLATGVTTVNGFLFQNDWSYGQEETTQSQIIMAFDGINTYMVPGNEYRLTTYIYCLEETSMQLSSMVPGGDYLGGTLCFSYYINGNSVLSVGDEQVEDLSGWLNFTANTSFIAGWNEIQILVYRPNNTNEVTPTLPSCLRFSFDPLIQESRNLYNITQMRFRKDPLTRVSEFALRILRVPGDRSAWAWSDQLTTTPNIILGNDWGYGTTTLLDNISVGVGANFLSDTRLGDPTISPSCWVQATLRGDEDLPPRIKSMQISAL